MTAAISAILPSIVSGATFSTRRTNRGVNSNNIVEGAANCVISGGQSYKALECSTELAKNLQNSKVGAKILSAHDAITDLAKGDEALKGVGKLFRFVGDNVNLIITLTEGLRVLNAEKKDEAAIESAFALGTMFTFERCAKKVLGISKFKRINGVNTAIPQKALYNDVKFVKNGVEKFVKWCSNTKVFGKSLQHLPSVLRGLGFVCASIAGYKVGTYIADKFIDVLHEHDKSPAKIVELNSNYAEKAQQKQLTAKEVSMNPQLLSYTQKKSA